MSDVTAKELIELQREFEETLAKRVNSMLTTFLKDAGGQAMLTNLQIETTCLSSGFPVRVTDQIVLGVSTQLKLQDGGGGYGTT